MSFESNLKKELDLKKKKQTDLLIDIFKKIGEKDPYGKALSEKSNFNNMIKGKRPFKVEYVIAIEEILGIRFSDLYKDEDIIQRYYALKGIRYAATIDDKNEYNKILDEGEKVFLNHDEYGKTIIDYICEYNSKNGLKFLIEKLKIKYDINRAVVNINGKESSIYDNSILKIVKMICLNEEVDYFNKLFPADYNMGYRYLYGLVYDSDDFYKSILSSNKIIKELFKLHETSFNELNPNRSSDKNEYYNVYHPVLFKVVEYALKHYKTYYEQLMLIFNEGIKTNNFIISELRRLHNYKFHIENYEIKNEYATYGYILYIDLSKYESLDDNIKNMIDSLNQNAKKVEIKPSSEEIEFNEHLEPRDFLDLIYRNSGLDNYFSDYYSIFQNIRTIVEEDNCKIEKIGDSLIKYLNEKKELLHQGEMSEVKYRVISFAISFAELYKDKLNNL